MRRVSVPSCLLLAVQCTKAALRAALIQQQHCGIQFAAACCICLLHVRRGSVHVQPLQLLAA